MPSSPASLCRRCSKRATSNSFCDGHQNAIRDDKRLFDVYRQHDEHRLMYRCARWRAARSIVLRRDILCKSCLHRTATVVHHVIDAVDWIAQGCDFYDVTNLVGWCKFCHDSHTAKTSGFAKRRG